jgi:hypothetical protein
MLGTAGSQVTMLGVVDSEGLIPSSHPTRKMKPIAEEMLHGLEPTREETRTLRKRPPSARVRAVLSVVVGRPLHCTVIGNTANAPSLHDAVLSYRQATLRRRHLAATPRTNL